MGKCIWIAVRGGNPNPPVRRPFATSNLTLGLIIDCHVVCESNGNFDQPFGEYHDIIIIIIIIIITAILIVVLTNVQSSRSSAHFLLGPLASRQPWETLVRLQRKYMGSTRGWLGPDDWGQIGVLIIRLSSWEVWHPWHYASFQWVVTDDLGDASRLKRVGLHGTTGCRVLSTGTGVQDYIDLDCILIELLERPIGVYHGGISTYALPTLQ